MSEEATQQVEQANQEAVVSQPLAMRSISQQPPAPSDDEIQAWQGQQEAPNAYESIIEQQQAQIAALMAQNDALNQQVTRMVQGGAQFTSQANTVFANGHTQQVAQPNTAQQFAQGSLSNGDDWSLEALGKEIGKPRREV